MEEFLKIFNRIIDLFVAYSLLAVTVIILVAVFFRYALTMPIMGSEALAKLAYIWMVFIGAAAVTREREHIRVTFFIDKLPPNAKSILEHIINVMIILFSIAVIKTGFSFMKLQKGIIASSIGIPRTAYTLAVPVGLVFMIFYYLMRFRKGKK